MKKTKRKNDKASKPPKDSEVEKTRREAAKLLEAPPGLELNATTMMITKMRGTESIDDNFYEKVQVPKEPKQPKGKGKGKGKSEKPKGKSKGKGKAKGGGKSKGKEKGKAKSKGKGKGATKKNEWTNKWGNEKALAQWQARAWQY